MKINLTSTEFVLSILTFFSIIAFMIALYVLYRFIKLYRKILESNLKTIEKYNDNVEPNIVAIGGGTGQSVFLRGLKVHTKKITAIVTVADDGGGSGALREDLGMLPPGDIRNCLLALANIEPTMNEVMQYRFNDGALKGQSFGNLFIAAMTGLYDNFETAVYKMSQIFAITGKVLPITLDNINLVAEFDNGQIVKGESVIPKYARENNLRINKLSLDKDDVKPLDEVISSIKNADVVVIGPGSLYTSILPNILVEGVVDALSSSSAPIIYICNIMTQPGESDGKNAVDHIKTIVDHAGIQFIDYVILNNEKLPSGVFERYAKDGAEMVILDEKQKEEIESLGITCIEQKLIEIKNGYIRHDSEILSSAVVKIATRHRFDENI